MRVMGSNAVTKAFSNAYGILATLPFRLRHDQIPAPKFVAHGNWADFLSKTFDKPGMRILEVGSRNVTGVNLRDRFRNAEYIGFDFYGGENVDIIGDVHRLSTYFDSHEKFDLIFSSAVFEHLCMPWVAAVEIQKLLKVGGFVFVETHFSFRSHERPWNFFQFSDMGLRALFNDTLGFDLVDKGMSSPIAGYFAHNAHPSLRYGPVSELYCHSQILCRKRQEIGDFDWLTVSPNAIVDGTLYPLPSP